MNRPEVNAVNDTLKARGWTHKELAEAAGMYVCEVKRLASYKKDVTRHVGKRETQMYALARGGPTSYRIEPVGGAYIVLEIVRSLETAVKRSDIYAKNTQIFTVDGAPWFVGQRITQGMLEHHEAKEETCSD